MKTDSTGIIAVINRVATERGRLDAETFAQRIAACVNFCAGVDLSTAGCSSLRELLTEFHLLRDGISRDTVNEWFRLKPPEPVVFPDKGEPQGLKVRKPRHKTPPPGVTRRSKEGC